jgi:hypothetical protein
METHTYQKCKHAKGNDVTLGSDPEGHPQKNSAVEKGAVQLLTRSHNVTYFAITGAFRQRSINWDACFEVRRSG